MFCFSFSCADFIFVHENFLLTGFNFSIKILLAKRTLLFWILLCYPFNMSPFCIGIISWCCLAVPLFYCPSHVPLFRGIRLFYQYSVVPPAFRCSGGIIPCSVVPGFIICHKRGGQNRTGGGGGVETFVKFNKRAEGGGQNKRWGSEFQNIR